MNMKNIKHEIRDRLPDILYSICWQRNNLKEVANQKKIMLTLNRCRRDYLRPKIVFFLQFPEVWNSFKTIYKSAIKDGAEVLVLCASKPIINGCYEKGLQTRNEAFDFCVKDGIRAIDAYDKNIGWFDLEKYDPDYIFYSRPYNHEIPPLYRCEITSKYSKICQINYTADVGISVNGDMSILSIGFTPYVYLRFLPSQKWLKLYRRRYALQLLLGTNKVKVLGTPRYDLGLTKIRELSNSLPNTIVWLPRWVMDKNENNIGSHFINYVYRLMEYMEKHKQVTLIIRPHPLMWDEIVNVGIMTQDEVTKLKNQLESVGNIKIDANKDYIDTLCKADILLADYTSLIVEYYITERPIIYCGKVPDSISKDTDAIFKSLYAADSWEEVQQMLDMLLDGQDRKRSERAGLIDKILPLNTGHIGSDIYQCILQDFSKYHSGPSVNSKSEKSDREY